MPLSATLAVRQTGAIGLFAILTLLLAILFAALAVDTGRLLMEERRLQTVADMAALDASSVAGSCGSGNLADVEAMAAASAARNNYNGLPLDVQVGQIDVGAGGVRQFTPAAIEQATSVSVTASKSVPASFFAGGIFGNQTTLQANAVAGREAIAGFSAGSMLLSISPDERALLNGLLSGILGSPVGLDVLSYEGIAATQLTLGELVDASASVGTVDELLSSSFTMGELLNLYADAVSASDVADVGVASGLDTLIAANVSDLTANFGDVLAVTSENPNDATNAEVNLFDLIMTSAFVANGENAIAVAPIELELLGLDVINQLTVTEPPQIAIGPPGRDDEGNWRTEVDTAQLQLLTGVNGNLSIAELPLLGGLLGPTLGALLDVEVDMDLTVNVAQGNAWLQSIQCGNVTDADAIVTVGGRSGVFNPLPSLNTDITIRAGGSFIANASVNSETLDVDTTGTTGTAVFEVNPYDNASFPTPPETIPGPGLGSLSANELDISLQLAEADCGLLGLGCLIGGVVNALLDLVSIIDESVIKDLILTPILDAIEQQVLLPLLEILGVQVGGMDIRLISVEIERPEMKR